MHLTLEDSDVGLCPSADCMAVSMTCRTYMGIRIIDPAEPLTPYLTQCDEVPPNNKKDLCSIGGINLKEQSLPLRDLEVQVALFPESMITRDENGDPVCPADTKYDASSGFPVASDVTPAVGGRTFYHPGDDKITVPLGCTNLELIQGCGGVGTVPVTAQVNDFDSGVTFTGEISVSVGQPIISDPFYVLGSSQLHVLEPVPGQRWMGSIDQAFPSFACLAVLDDAPQSTTSVVCRRSMASDLSLSWPRPPIDQDPDDDYHVGSGVRLSKAALDQMLAALSLSSFPTHGLTIGIVLDKNGNAVANQVVASTDGTIDYLSGDRTAVGGTKTSISGVFASLDAPFGTVFTATGGTPARAHSRVGGNIDGKITIVVLQFTTGGIGG
ncbi:hypothetical protein BH11MYX3_BH11MYX3_20010 [soil metagenome]